MYDASGGLGPAHISGVVSDITKPFVLKVTSPGAAGSVRLSPAGASHGLGTVQGVSTGQFGAEETNGTFSLTKTATGYVARGPVRTCLDNNCSPEATFVVTFTERKSK